MSNPNPLQTAEIRDVLLSQPDLILDDPDVMRALVGANESAMGGNVVDMRGLAMERLEARLDRLEDTNRHVIAAAYENLAGTNMIHRAILRLLEAPTFAGFMADLAGPVADTLRVDRLRLLLEASDAAAGPDLNGLDETVAIAEQGFCCLYAGTNGSGAPRRVTLRQCMGDDAGLYRGAVRPIRSEACLLLDFGDGHLPGLLVLGSEDPDHFAPSQGSDLLDFFAGVFERSIRRWLE